MSLLLPADAEIRGDNRVWSSDMMTSPCSCTDLFLAEAALDDLLLLDFLLDFSCEGVLLICLLFGDLLTSDSTVTENLGLFLIGEIGWSKLAPPYSLGTDSGAELAATSCPCGRSRGLLNLKNAGSVELKTCLS